MPTTRTLAKLFQALSAKDISLAERIATEIATAEKHRGHHSAAQLLSAALRSNGINGHRVPDTTIRTPSQINLLKSALTLKSGPTLLADVMLRGAIRTEIESIINETQQRSLLSSKGINRRAKLLFVGPPGCGKSFTAQAIANELHLPHYVVRFDSVIGAYLGQTAIHLRELFQFATETPCVLLFDEIDALGKQRGNPLDVGELDRIVIALMQELEYLKTDGIVIATSNLPQNLDHALWRRFDLTLKFPTPRVTELRSYGRKLASRFHLGWNRRLDSLCSKARSYADGEKIIEAEARRLALRES
jgi:SpoVK/Ycf46/Vps4 family AAA+-type ATPase